VRQVPTRLTAGTLLGMRPAIALACGLTWGFLTWVFAGSLLAASFAWRPSGRIPAASRQELAPAIDRACVQFRLRVLDDTPARVVLGPRRVRLVLAVPARLRLRLQEVCIDFADDAATLTAPAPIFWDLRRELRITSPQGPQT
jgi:hypothetical protein